MTDHRIETSKKLLDTQIRSYSITSDTNDSILDETEIDETYSFLIQHQHFNNKLTESQERAITKKLYIWLIPLLMAINTVMFIDKAVLSYGILLGLFESTRISQDQYNNLNSYFYIGYLLGQLPLNFIAQRYNFAKFIKVILLIWVGLIFSTGLANDYKDLVILRFSLGFFESVVMPALSMTMNQFFTPREKSMAQPLFWISCTGPAVWISGITSYVLLNYFDAEQTEIAPWRLFMGFVGGLTLLVAIWTWVIYPSNPTDARFLTIEERVLLIEKVSTSTSSAIEQKQVKRYQIVECLKDPLTWLFTGFGCTSMLHNNVSFQSNILYKSLGFSNLGVTIINLLGGVFSSLFLISGIYLIYKVKESSALTVLYSGIPGFVGSLGMVLIPDGYNWALAITLFITNHTFALAFIVIVGWNVSSAGGYTKKFYRNICFMIGYSIANIISPQLWRGDQGNRYYTAWWIQIVLAYGTPLILAIIIHVVLKRRNIERFEYVELSPDTEYGRVVRRDSLGNEIIENVEVSKLDLTDLENKRFIYPL